MSVGLFLPTCLIEVLLPLSSVAKIYVFPHAYSTLMAGTFTMAGKLLAGAAGHNDAEPGLGL